MDRKKRATIPNRETIVVSAEIHQGLKCPSGLPIRRVNDGTEARKGDWLVAISSKTGMDNISTSLFACESKAEAEKVLKAHPIGENLEDMEKIKFLLENEISGEQIHFFISDGESFHGVCYEVLFDSGVITKGYNTAKIVFDDFSIAEKDAYKSRYGDNWEVALWAAYVLSRYHSTSLAGYAVRIFFCHYILGDDYLAGYLWREMEMVLSESETVALQEAARKRKSSWMSGKASHDNKMKRIEALLSEMERIALNNPDTHIYGDVMLAQAAMKKAIEANPELWSQGQQQHKNYLSEMRTNPDLRPRYLKMFPKSA